MTRFPVLTCLLLALPATALADATTTAPVIGGDDAPAGKWPDAAGMIFDYDGFESVDCSGTLIAPELVITAGHCNDASLVRVLIGSTSRSRLGDGEVIDVVQRWEYPDSWNSYDIAILRLAEPSTKTPRPIATGWARHDIVDGATAALVGFGAVDENGTQTVDALQEAMTTITDAACARMPGCNLGARPNGELGAGGSGIDTCPGDSGGPLYLVTEYGTFLAGVTSRAYADATRACSDGGIYGRPDKIVDWIEETSGIELPRARDPIAEVLVAEQGRGGSVRIDPNDPRPGTSHAFAVVTQGQHGTAEVGADGTVVYTPSDAEYLGPDALVVEVADAALPSRKVTIAIEVDVVEATDEGGCCSTGRGSPAGALAPAALVALALFRRRRR